MLLILFICLYHLEKEKHKDMTQFRFSYGLVASQLNFWGGKTQVCIIYFSISLKIYLCYLVKMISY